MYIRNEKVGEEAVRNQEYRQTGGEEIFRAVQRVLLCMNFSAFGLHRHSLKFQPERLFKNLPDSTK